MGRPVIVNEGGGIGVGGALLVVFIALKLTNNIDWSWWWVLSPIWIGFIVAAFLIMMVMILKD